MYVLAYKMNERFWALPEEEKEKVNTNIISFIGDLKKDLISIKYYKSIRHDNDILFWSASESPLTLEKLKEDIIEKKLFPGFLYHFWPFLYALQVSFSAPHN